MVASVVFSVVISVLFSVVISVLFSVVTSVLFSVVISVVVSLEGAVYEVYMVTGKDQPYDERYKVGTFTTKLRQQTNNETLTAIGIPEILNSCGVENQFRMPDDSLVAISADQEECVFSGLPFGWYAVVEVKESEGFALDPVIYYKHLTPEHPEEKVRQTILSVETTTETTTENTTETTTENTTETTTETTKLIFHTTGI